MENFMPSPILQDGFDGNRPICIQAAGGGLSGTYRMFKELTKTGRQVSMVEFKRDRIGNVPFSLHDSKIQAIIIRKNSIIITLDRIFEYADGEEKWYPCEVEFTKIDLDYCDIKIFNYPYGTEGVNEFTGKSLSLKEFIEEYQAVEFEIVTETYFGYDTVYQGEIWQGEEEPLFAIMSIWNMGDMIYRIEKN